ncbi:MAG: putative porin [Candidatus Kapaibacterium sp.]
MANSYVFGQDAPPDSAKSSTQIPDSLLSIPLMRHGSAAIIPDIADFEFDRRNIPLNDYLTLSEIAEQKFPIYPMNLGSFGNMNMLSVFGGSPREMIYMYDSRPVSTPSAGLMNPSIFPVEFLESVELLSGTSAAVLTGRSAAMNISEVRYNTEAPYTRIWFADAGFDLLGADAIFSQNFAPDWNFTFGFRSLSSTGRYDNSWLESWNVRALVRWNLSPYTNISLTENFTNHGIGTNGGIDPAGSPDVFDDLDARVNYEGLNERQFRHDLTLNMTSIFDRDTTRALSARLFFSAIDHDRHRPRELVMSVAYPNLQSQFSELYGGFAADYEHEFYEILYIKTGGIIQFTDFPATEYSDDFSGYTRSAYIFSTVRPHPLFEFDYGIRFNEEPRHGFISFGGTARLMLSDSAEIELDYSRSGRAPSPYEGLDLDSEIITLATISADVRMNSFGFRGGVFYRSTDNLISSAAMYAEEGLVVNTSSFNNGRLNTAGAYAEIKCNPIDNIYLEAFGQAYFSQLNDEAIRLFPEFYGGITAYYEVRVGESLLRLGGQSKFITSFRGLHYFPLTYDYYLSEYRSNPAVAGIDVFARARLGNAFIKASFANALSSGYYYVPVYPMLDRNIRLSVSWAFMN